MAKRRYKQTYDGHKHKFYIVKPDVYRCSYPRCRRWYTNVNWILWSLNENHSPIFFKPLHVEGELFTGVLGYRR